MIEYPIYIISKGRYDVKRKMTWDFLKDENIDFVLIVEPSEAKEYEKITENLLVLPKDNYGTSIYARMYALEDSLKKGYSHHFLLDDNMKNIVVLWKGRRYTTKISYLLKSLNIVSKMYEDVLIYGFQEYQFLLGVNVPISFNNHIYSFFLIDNTIYEKGIHWRLKYNEDVDICLQTIAKGYFTAQIRLFSFHKYVTREIKGGNTDTLYKGRNSKVLKTNILKAYYPNIVKVDNRFGRYHHVISWQKFPKIPKKKLEYERWKSELISLYRQAVSEVKV